MSIGAVVQAHAALHAQLYHIFDTHRDAESSFGQQSSRVDELVSRLEDLDILLERMSLVTIEEKRQFESTRDSASTRLTYKLTGRSGKYVDKQEKEEKAYLHAVEEEQVARRQREELVKELDDAARLFDQLKEDAATLAQAKKELEELYNVVFDGPTPLFPDDDILEDTIRSCETIHKHSEKDMQSETKAVELLEEARGCASQCLEIMSRVVEDAKKATRGSPEEGDLNRKLPKRLDEAHHHASRTLSLAQQARSSSRRVDDIGLMVVSDQRSFPQREASEFHEEVTEQTEAIKKAEQNVQMEWRAAQRRLESARKEVELAKERLQESRHELFQLRMTQFLAVVNNLDGFSQKAHEVSYQQEVVVASGSTPFQSFNIRPITPPPYIAPDEFEDDMKLRGQSGAGPDADEENLTPRDTDGRWEDAENFIPAVTAYAK